MVVVLTQSVNPAVSPVLLVLILGLPILDTLSVMFQRIREGRSPFSPDRNHLHHKLLASGLLHYEAVASIYILQGLFVGAALFLRYESDLMLGGIYLIACIAVVLFIRMVRYVRLDSTRSAPAYLFDNALKVARQHVVFREGPLVFLMLALPVFLVAGASTAAFIPKDFGVLAAIAFVLLSVRLIMGYRAWFLFLRLLIFVAIAFVTYLFEMEPPALPDNLLAAMNYAYFGLLAAAIVLVVRYRVADTFKITPMDFLVILAMLSIGVIPEDVRETYHLVPVIVKLVMLFYGVELILKTMKSRWSVLPLSSLTALGILALRGLLG
jgi:UDP-GlcNAc:undecaprenyl-phosphate GlcNAc-1-phosphate transferase